MPDTITMDEALMRASWTYTVRIGTVQPATDDTGTAIGWTFATQKNGSLQYGWVLIDGRVSPATEWTRPDAEDCARQTVRDSR